MHRLHIARKAIPRRETDAGVIRIEIIHPHGGKDFSLEQLGRAGRHQPKQPIGGGCSVYGHCNGPDRVPLPDHDPCLIGIPRRQMQHRCQRRFGRTMRNCGGFKQIWLGHVADSVAVLPALGFLFSRNKSIILWPQAGRSGHMLPTPADRRKAKPQRCRSTRPYRLRLLRMDAIMLELLLKPGETVARGAADPMTGDHDG